LKQIISRKETPQTIDADVFGSVPAANVRLFVPASAVSAYKAATGWSNFSAKTEAIPFTVKAEIAVGENLATFDAGYTGEKVITGTSDNAVVVVENGKITAGAGNTAMITATLNGGYFSDVFEVAVIKGNPTVTWPTEATITYGQTLAQAAFTGGSGAGTFAFTESTTSLTVAQSGTSYQVTFTPTDAANYNTITQNVAITVNKATPTATFPTSASITFGQTLAQAAFTGGSGAGTFAFTESTTSLTVAQSGSQHQVTFTPTDAANYSTRTQNVAVTVNKASDLENNSQIFHQISASNTNTHTYDLKTLTLNKADHGTLGYSLAGALAGSDPTILADISLDGNGILSYKGAGKTSGTATQAITITSQNYENITATITFEATAKEEIAITVTEVNSYTYDGNPKSGYTGAATAPPYTGELVYEWAGTGHSQDDTPPTNAGEYTLRITLPPDAPYIGAKRIEFTIAKKQIAKPAVTNTNLAYTGNEQSAGIAANAAYTVTGDKGTAANSYTATVALKDKANHEWADGTTDDLSLPWAIAVNTPIIPQIATGSIRVQATANAITLENLPRNTKVQVYTLQGKQIHSANSENSQILRIPVQTKGIYVVKAGNQTLRVTIK